jgi:hypothetical protein
MKKVLLFVTLLIGSVSFGQTIMVNGSPYLVYPNYSFPFWLDAGSTLSTNPPMNFISVVEYNENEVGDDTNLGYSKVLSITESSVVPDGKVWKVISALQYHYEGCTDETMFNFDPQANVDDGSCIEIVEGCFDPTAFNYSAEATTDDGSCIEGLEGCLDESACNYNPDANMSDGSCQIPELGYDCDGAILQIGSFYQGGIIFWLDQAEPGYGYVLSTNEYGPMSWDDAMYYANTIDYMGYDDWYIPSKNRCDDIYYNIGNGSGNNILELDYNYYWTSVEESEFLAHDYSFNDGGYGGAVPKTNSYDFRVIIIRQFQQ